MPRYTSRRKVSAIRHRPSRLILLQLLAVLGTLAAMITAGVVVLLKH